MPNIIRQMQLGKNGLTEGFICNLKHHFDNCKNIKISVLRSCCRDKEELKEITEKILNSLGDNYTAKAIGYTISLKRWRRQMRNKEEGTTSKAL
jgi:RNA-binding protein YhbY